MSSRVLRLNSNVTRCSHFRDLLYEVFDVDNPDQIVLKSKFLQENNVIEKLKFVC